MADNLVLVTGASGYVGTHVIKVLQESGHRVRGTVRSLKDQQKVKHLYDLCPGAKYPLELVEADLLAEDTWPKAVSGCTYVHHVASPYPAGNPKTDDEVIKPAVDGTMNVLCACAKAGTVKRVVLTSSFIAVGAGGGNTVPYDETNWPTEDFLRTTTYGRSKVKAERAAWDFVNNLPEHEKFELSVTNPTAIFGPALHGNAGTSTDIVKSLLLRELPRVPKFYFPVIDVRDVAKAHLVCMTESQAAGKRHILTSGTITYLEMAHVLDREFRPQGYNVPTGELGSFMVTVLSWFSTDMKTARNFAEKENAIDTSRMRNVLRIHAVDKEKTILDMAYSMIDGGFVKKTDEYRGRPSS